MKENTVNAQLGGGCIVVSECEIKKTEVVARDNAVGTPKGNRMSTGDLTAEGGGRRE
jgi:hypothetical protein